MAQAQATPQDSGAAPPKKRRKLLIVFLIVLTVLLVAAAGVVALLLLKKSAASADGAQAQAPGAGGSTAVDLSRPPVFVTLDPFVVNLAPGEGDRYLQVVMALRVTDTRTGDALKGFMPEIRHRINLLLSSKLPSELATLDGREDLALDIADEINLVLGVTPERRGGEPAAPPPIRSVLFNSLIIQ